MKMFLSYPEKFTFWHLKPLTCQVFNYNLNASHFDNFRYDNKSGFQNCAKFKIQEISTNFIELLT